MPRFRPSPGPAGPRRRRRTPALSAGTLAALAFLAPLPAFAVDTDEKLTVAIEPDTGDFEDDLDVIGAGDCAAKIARPVVLTAADVNSARDQEARFRVIVTDDTATVCAIDDVRSACDDIGTAVEGCTCLSDSDTMITADKVELTSRPLATLLPGGGATACTNGEEKIYRFYLVLENADGLQKALKATDADAGTTADASTVGITALYSKEPLQIEIDLDPPDAPQGDFNLAQGDRSVVVEFPSGSADDVEDFRVCWSTGGLASIGSAQTADAGALELDAAAAPTGGIVNCKTSSGTCDLEITTADGLTMETTYTFSVAGIDNAGNVGVLRSIGTASARNYLDFAEYYRKLHGTETGGCHLGPGSAGTGLGLSLLALSTVFALRRRRRPPCA